MAGSARLLRALLRALITGLVALAAGSQLASAQTPDQIEAFRNLPPDQQQAVLESMRGQGSSGVDDQARAQDAVEPVVPMDGAQRESLQPTLQPSPPRAAARGTVVLAVTTNTDVSDADRATIVGRREQILAHNPYSLDEEGRLHLPFLAPIALGGLTDKEAALRLNADPRLAGLTFVVTLLPVAQIGIEALKPFGYDLFAQRPERFARASGTALATPADYSVGPGDQINIDLFGKKTGRYRLVVNRDGSLTIPELGPLQVSGMSFDQLRAEIERRVSDQLIGVRASVTTGELRALRVFVVGDVIEPGSHQVSSLSTVTGALFASGGIAPSGSLRAVELKRRGALVTRFDLYDLLLKGDTSRDLQLQQGDAIFVPPVGFTAGVSGQIQRPAIYEFRDGATVNDLLDMAGGAKPDAALRAAKLQRIDAGGSQRIVLDVDLTAATDRGRPLRSGDVLTVPRVLDEFAGSVMLEGQVHRPGPYAWRSGMRLTDALGGMEALKLNADQRYVLIRREHMPDRRIEVMSADAVAAFAARGTDADPLLQSHDRVIVFSRQADRGTSLSAVLEELRLQVRDNSPLPVVSVGGRVRAPGEYPYEPGMTVSDIIRAGGGMDDAAYALTAELTRYEVINGDTRQTEVIDLDLRNLTAGAAASDLAVRPYDVLVIKEVPDWREQEQVELRGEVRFPGTYPIRRGETLSALVERAGGLTEAAFPAGTVFLRDELKAQEREQVETLTNRLQADLALLALQSSQAKDSEAGETLAAGQALLQQLRSAEPKGRLVVDLNTALTNKGSDDDIELRGGDALLVPRLRQYVTVIGEVQNATSHVWKQSLAKADYVALSGGMTSRADAKRSYVVRANGSVVPSRSGGSWFSRGDNAELEPGSTIVVPIDAERMRPLPLWTAVTTVIYNLAVATAAIGSL
jgi:polysaccharide biosynthesis/export protein